jgi:uncharacterized phage protein (TIGR02218 family)
MRAAPAAAATYLAANNVTARADLWTITLVDGTTVYRWTSYDADLTVGGNTYLSAGASAPLVRRGPYRQSIGLEIDTLDLTINGQGFTIGGKALGLLGIQGYFDGARVRLDHLIMPTPGDVSLGAISSFFAGRVAGVEPRGVDLLVRLKSELETLNVMLPRFTIQPSCGNAVFDANCGLVRATWTDAAQVSASTTTTIATTSATPVAHGSGWYDLGVVTFTSGLLAGRRFSVASSAVASSTLTLTLAMPLTSLPTGGDTFTITTGCDRTRSTCVTKYSNLSRWRGYPHVPSPESGS